MLTPVERAELRNIIVRSDNLKIVASNIRDGEKLQILPLGFTDSIFRRVIVGLRLKMKHRAIDDDDILNVIEDVCLGRAVPGPKSYPIRPGSRFLCCAETAGGLDNIEWLSSVTTLEAFENLVPDEQWEKMFGRFVTKTGNPSYDPLLTSVLQPDWTGSFTAGPTFQYGNPIAWFTERGELQAAIENRENLADAARDVLGLIHRKEATRLVILHFPAHALAQKRSGRPSFADAGRHSRFMLAPTSQPPMFPSHWGQTLDLESLALNARLSDGARERVITRITADDLDGAAVEVTYLGALSSTRGVPTTEGRHRCVGDDADFARLQVQRDEAGFAQVTGRV